MAKILYGIKILATGADSDSVTGILCQHVPFGWQEASLPEGSTAYTVYCEDRDYLYKLAKILSDCVPDIKIEQTSAEATDWLEAWKSFFTPVPCGSRFIVLPPWLANNDYEQRIKIIIEPKSAFGTGHHASTALCLTALSDLLDKGKIKSGDTFMDLGCGSGVLAIAAAKSGMHGLALDIDELAVANALENRELNGIENLRIKHGDLDAAADHKFDLIMANILAGPLIDMAPQLCGHLRDRGSLILSGILDIQADAVEKAFMACGLPKCRRLAQDEWRALVWQIGEPVL